MSSKILGSFFLYTVTNIQSPKRKLEYNSGTEYLRLSGVVRPDDISSSNTISSKKVADAQISYVGTGDMNDSVTKGWLSRYFAYVSPF